MTAIKLAYVHRFRDRHGKIRFYFRRPGYARLPLPGMPASVEFMAAYQAALAGEPLPIGAAKVLPGSMASLVAAFFGSAAFKQLAPASQKSYRLVIERFREKYRDLPVASLQAQHIRRMMDAKAETPAAANRMRQMLRQLMQFAVERGIRKDDPTIGIKKLRYKKAGFIPWTEADITAFEVKWPVGTRARLALALLLYTGQRRSDVIKMGPHQVEGAALILTQQKTGTRLAIPLHSDLRAILAHVEGEPAAYLMTQVGKPFASPNAFYNWFKDCCAAAGVPDDRSPHGLRKAAARRLAQAGCTPHQIAAITGHLTLSEVERYTRDVEQEGLAQEAMARVTSARKKVAP